MAPKSTKQMKINILILLLSINSFANAQSIRALLFKDSAGIKSFKGYGEMFAKETKLKEEPTIIIGGRGGFILNRTLAFGGVGTSYLLQSRFAGYDQNGNSTNGLNLRMGLGGVHVEYVHQMEMPIHISVPISFMVGNLTVTNSLSGNQVENSSVLVIEPGFNLDFNFSRILIVSLTTSYRIARIDSLRNLTNSDISGLVLGLVGRFGNF